MTINVNPTPLAGCWNEGYSLDEHTLYSVFVGDDEWVHPHYDTKRTEIGELLFRLKYRGDKSSASALAETAAQFVKDMAWPVQLVAPMPPSVLTRAYQPVWVLGEAIAERLGVEYCQTCLTKKTETPQLKNTFDPALREKALEGVLRAAAKVRSKIVLLFDDLASSGTTLDAAAKALTEEGTRGIYVLTLTKTRTMR